MKKKQSTGNRDKDWYEEGRRLNRDGNHREAIKAFDLAIKDNPLYAEAYFVRGACYYALGSCRQAGEDLDAAAILGCQEAQFWSRYPIYSKEKNQDEKEK